MKVSDYRKEKKRKKIKLTLLGRVLLFTLLFCIALLIWNKFRFLFNNQPFLDNRLYPLELDSINATKKKLYKKRADKAELEKNFLNLINKKVFPYWYGTKWDFNGTTETPNDGSIACGYFVTTVLRDMGVPIKRSRMAQCPSEEMIRSLVSKKNVHHLSGIDINTFETKLKQFGNGIYVTGLDKHTGFILLSDEGNYFIHSSGMYPFQVVKEPLLESNVLIKSNYRVVGKISSDEGFLRKWVKHARSQ
ncbi:hypothetical protein Emtol_1001 [Sporocytophaga myxococcoides]|uniref:Uncharacterized protein n=1 Tax=Sporocytophaga myxococcoides TaxID=153721 RepID=A0A098LFE8_9BACT|nr:hypothetical protein [Sporocytophaga myxococcoides]GAL85710.1 hypothetical protein Emtol_1001 [Sporocytophaga myxococcoides]